MQHQFRHPSKSQAVVDTAQLAPMFGAMINMFIAVGLREICYDSEGKCPVSEVEHL